MIRTVVVDLTTIPAVAYRQKLPSGDIGVTILRYDSAQPGLATIGKKGGNAVIASNTPADLYPAAAFDEAIALTSGMPYSRNSSVKLKKKKVEEAPAPKADETDDDVIINDADYQKLIEAYTDKTGKLSFDILSRDLIKFAHRSKVVSEMISDQKSIKAIRSYITLSKFASVTGNRQLTSSQADKMAALLDEVSKKSIYKELNAELKKDLAAAKKN